jgi:hypothetical protein
MPRGTGHWPCGHRYATPRSFGPEVPSGRSPAAPRQLPELHTRNRYRSADLSKLGGNFNLSNLGNANLSELAGINFSSLRDIPIIPGLGQAAAFVNNWLRALSDDNTGPNPPDFSNDGYNEFGPKYDREVQAEMGAREQEEMQAEQAQERIEYYHEAMQEMQDELELDVAEMLDEGMDMG